MSNDDRITRAGLQAFANKCKETFLQPAVLDNIASNCKVINYQGSLASTNGVLRFQLNMLGSLDADSYTNFSQSSADVYINLISADKTFYYDNGTTKIDSIYYNVITNTDGSVSLSIYFITSLYEAMVLRSATFYTGENQSIINMSKSWEGLDVGIIDDSYTQITKKVIPTTSEGNTSFSVSTGPADEDKQSYSSGSVFDTILQARQLNHKLQFQVDNTQTDYTTDLSPTEDANVTTIYVKGVSSSTGSFSGEYDSVTVANGVVIDGRSREELIATDNTPGYIQLGYQTTSNKTIPLKLDESNKAYIELPTGLLTYKGSVENYDNLPTTGNTNGDVYSVKDNFGEEYVWIVKDGSNGNWEYLGEKFVQQDVYWEKPEGEGEGWKGKLLQNRPQLAAVATSGSYNDLSDRPEIPSITINKPTNNTDGSIKVGDNSISIKSSKTVSTGDDILVSKAYVDALIPTDYISKITLNGVSVTGSATINTLKAIKFSDNLEVSNGEYVVNEDRIVTLPKYPDVPIKQITVDGDTVNPTDGVVALTTPNIPIKTVKVDGTALNADANGAVNIKSSQYFANSLEYDSNATLDISNFIPELTPDHCYEKTVLIYNKSNNDITLELPTSTSVAIIPMTSFPLTVGGNKYAEIVATYYPKEPKSILTINGGVQV